MNWLLSIVVPKDAPQNDITRNSEAISRLGERLRAGVKEVEQQLLAKQEPKTPKKPAK